MPIFRSNEDILFKNRMWRAFVRSANVEITILTYFDAHKENSPRDLTRECSVN